MIGLGTVLSIGNTCLKKYKIPGFLLVLFMWMVFAGNQANADYIVNYNKYYSANNSALIVEPVFSFISSLLNSLGLDYQQFLMIVSFFLMFSIIYISYKLANGVPFFVLALYLIFPLVFNIVLVRFTTGLIFVYFGLYRILEKKKMDVFTYLFFFLGGLCHFSLLFTLILPIVVKFSKKQIIIITLVSSVLLLFFVGSTELINLLSFGSNNVIFEKMVYVLNNTKSGGFPLQRTIQVIMSFTIFIVIWWIIRNEKKEDWITDTIFKINTSMLILLPLMWINGDLYRIQILTVLLNYILLAKCFVKNSNLGAIPIKNIYLSLLGLFFSLLYLTVFILLDAKWYNNVWIPILTNNLFF